jgi:IclR helix-turn-helix domain
VDVFLQAVPLEPTPLTEPISELIVSLADVTTWVRSPVARDGYSRDIVAHPEAEAPTRFAKQLAGLRWGALAIGLEPDAATDMLRRVSLDSMPPRRTRVIAALATESMTTKAVAEKVGLPTSTTHRVMEDLAALGVLRRHGHAGGDLWTVTEDATERLKLAGQGGETLTRNVGTPKSDAPLPALISSPLPLESIFRVSEDLGGESS